MNNRDGMDAILCFIALISGHLLICPAPVHGQDARLASCGGPGCGSSVHGSSMYGTSVHGGSMFGGSSYGVPQDVGSYSSVLYGGSLGDPSGLYASGYSGGGHSGSVATHAGTSTFARSGFGLGARGMDGYSGMGTSVYSTSAPFVANTGQPCGNDGFVVSSGGYNAGGFAGAGGGAAAFGSGVFGNSAAGFYGGFEFAWLRASFGQDVALIIDPPVGNTLEPFHYENELSPRTWIG